VGEGYVWTAVSSAGERLTDVFDCSIPRSSCQHTQSRDGVAFPPPLNSSRNTDLVSWLAHPPPLPLLLSVPDCLPCLSLDALSLTFPSLRSLRSTTYLLEPVVAGFEIHCQVVRGFPASQAPCEPRGLGQWRRCNSQTGDSKIELWRCGPISAGGECS